MGQDSAGVIGMDVGHVHGVGTTIAGRSGDAAVRAKGLLEGLDAARHDVGHPVVRAQLAAFVSHEISHDAHRLGPEVEAAGDHVAGVAATARTSDESGAQGVTAPLLGTQQDYGRLDDQVVTQTGGDGR